MVINYLIIPTGVSYKKLSIENIQDIENFYMKGKEVFK